MRSLEQELSLPTQNLATEAAPALPTLDEVAEHVRHDSAQADRYLENTVVPFGGE